MYAFCTEIVATREKLEKRKRRVRYWGALALLRCVMSSPAAALTALTNRAKAPRVEEEDEKGFSRFVFESAEDRTDDDSPTPVLEAADATLSEADQRKLRELARLAKSICTASTDTKLARAIEIVHRLLKEGFYPILWCRYVATAEYLGRYLREALKEKEVQVVVITGHLGDEERREKIEKIEADRPRVLVATDCLSEGINLQEKFTAVIHYDLPWNPKWMTLEDSFSNKFRLLPARLPMLSLFGSNRFRSSEKSAHNEE